MTTTFDDKALKAINERLLFGNVSSYLLSVLDWLWRHFSCALTRGQPEVDGRSFTWLGVEVDVPPRLDDETVNHAKA